MTEIGGGPACVGASTSPYRTRLARTWWPKPAGLAWGHGTSHKLATLLGHLGGTADFQHLPDAGAIASLRLAASRSSHRTYESLAGQAGLPGSSTGITIRRPPLAGGRKRSNEEALEFGHKLLHDNPDALFGNSND